MKNIFKISISLILTIILFSNICTYCEEVNVDDKQDVYTYTNTNNNIQSNVIYANGNNITYSGKPYSVEKFVDQTRVLNVVNMYLHGDSTDLGNGKYLCNVYCYPRIYLKSGNCYIEWTELRDTPIDLFYAFEKTVEMYSLKTWMRTFNILYSQDQITIELDNETQNEFYSNKYPTPGYINYVHDSFK